MSINIYNENCLVGMMSRIADHSVDMILCDLPYGVTDNAWDAVIPFEPLWAQYKRVIKPHGAIVLTASQPFTGQLAASNLSWLKYEWIWVKSCPVGFLNAKKQPMGLHENILVFGQGRLTYNPQGLRPHNKLERRGRDSKNYRATIGHEVWQEWTDYPRSVLFFPYEQIKDKVHPTQKPTNLFEYLIRTYSNPGDLVLDNCMGSGTTGVACVQSARDFIGFELDPVFFTIAKERIEATVPVSDRACIDGLFEDWTS